MSENKSFGMDENKSFGFCAVIFASIICMVSFQLAIFNAQLRRKASMVEAEQSSVQGSSKKDVSPPSTITLGLSDIKLVDGRGETICTLTLDSGHKWKLTIEALNSSK